MTLRGMPVSVARAGLMGWLDCHLHDPVFLPLGSGQSLCKLAVSPHYTVGLTRG